LQTILKDVDISVAEIYEIVKTKLWVNLLFEQKLIDDKAMYRHNIQLFKGGLQV
jgi:hypothetical protein